VFFALQVAGLGLAVQLLPLWFALRFGASSTAIAPWFAAAQLTGLALIPFVPALARRLGVGGVILLAVGVSTLLLVGMPLAPILPVAGLFYILRTDVVLMQWPAQLSFLQRAVDPRLRGLATSVSIELLECGDGFVARSLRVLHGSSPARVAPGARHRVLRSGRTVLLPRTAAHAVARGGGHDDHGL